ncbi:MAG: hypothetical protein M3Z21_16735 [Pseudomonadota bacterium]|nr:hypothetical protein [Pseudomonadota bacterium]
MAGKPPLAGFDSASAMARALGRYLRGRDFPVLGLWPGWAEPLLGLMGDGINALPAAWRKQVYIWSGWGEAVKADRLAAVRSAGLARWAVAQYPRRRYPAALIGSSNGALTHLGAALGAPWLPQTLLIPVRRGHLDPDEPQRELAWARGPAAQLLAANPDLVLHHMHDPNQDRLMVQRMSYFRVKFARLPDAYARFLEETLEPGATLFTVECALRWPACRAADRHFFQFGALGGMTPEEYLHGSPRLAAFLKRQGSRHRRWQWPPPDGEYPEAEWGFEPSLRADIKDFARRRGLRLRRIVFARPEDLSLLVAGLYRWWHRRRGLPADRLLVENFILLEPWWTLRSGAVPLWLVFNVEPSAAVLEQYLDTAEPYDAIHLMLFSHGVESVGVAPIERWRALLRRARRQGELLGVDERAYPRDFATFVRYHADLAKLIDERHPLPEPLGLDGLDTFLAAAAGDYPVRWLSEKL